MKQKRFSDEQIIDILKEADAGAVVLDLCRCFLPIHGYDTATSRPVATLLRHGITPSGAEVRNHLRRLVRRFRQHWPHTRLTFAATATTAARGS